MNTKRIANFFDKARHSYAASSKVQRETAELLLYHIDQFAPYMLNDQRNRQTILGKRWGDDYRHLLDLGCGVDAYTASLALHRYHWPRKSRFELVDLVKVNTDTVFVTDPFVYQLPLVVEYKIQSIEQWLDENKFNQYDLVLSNAALHWLKNPEEAIARISKVIRKGGIFALSVFGPNNLSELQRLGFTGMDYHFFEFWRGWLQSAGFEILQEANLKFTDHFANPIGVIEHLKQTGVNGAVQSKHWTKQKLLKFVQDYSKFKDDKGGVTLTYNPMIFIVRKRLN